MATEYLSEVNENQVNSQPIIKEITQEEKLGEKQKKGLNNSGNSSYINSVIHCLSTYKEFIKMFLNENIKDFLEKHKLLQGLKDILLFLYDKNQEKIRNKLLEDWRLNFCELIPKYKDKDKHDPLEFILDLLNTISNIINENISSVPEIWKYSEDINEINFGDNLIRESWVRQTNKDKSKINELFGGLITTEVSCAFCNYKDTDKSSKNEPFVLLDFPIPDVLTMKVKIIYLDKGTILRDTIEIHINDCLTVKQLKILCKQNMNQLLINDNIEMRAILISGNSCKGIHTKMIDDEDILYHSKSLEYLSVDQIDLKTKEVYIVMAQKYIQEEKQKNLDDSLNQVFDEYNSSNSIRSSLASFASSFISISSDHSHSSIINKYLIVIPFRYIEKEASGCGREQRVLRSYECSNYPFVFNICIQKNENNKLDIKELLVKIGSMLYPKTDISEHLKLENKLRIEFFFLNQLNAKQFDDHYDEKNIIHELKKFFKSSSSKQFCLFYEEKREYGKVFEPNFPVLNLQENIDLNTCFKVWRDNPNEYQKCIKCNHLLNIKSTLSKIPRFLCIYLNRISIKKNKRTENTRIVSIEEEFDIQPFTYHKLINEEYKSMYNKKDCKYKLIAVNQHFTSFFKENYVALNKLNDTWYSFEDDKKIKELTFDKISSPKTIMLFYERVQTDEDKNDNTNIINKNICNKYFYLYMQNTSRRSSKTITKTTYFSDIASIPTTRTFSDDNNNVCKTNRKMHLSLTGVVSDINKKKFIDQNKQALKTYDNMLKNIRQKKKIVITSKTKDITEHNSKFLLTAFDFNSIITNEEDFEKKKKINKFKLRGFKSNVIGVDEHLIELPKINDEFRINHYQSHNTFYNLNGINTIKKNNIYEYNRTDYNDNSLKRKRFVSPFPKSGQKDLYSPRKMKNKNLFTSSPIRKEKISHSLNNNAKNSKQVENIKKNSIKNQLSTNDTEFSKVDPQMINEIKKLNQWDRKHAVNVYKGTYRPSLNMQIFLNSLGQSSNQWLMDIKADPKQIEILSRNKHLKNFFTKIDKEQKAISYQSVSLYKKGFNFDIFNENKNKKRSSSDDTDQFLAQVDVYREIMRERMKIEEFLKNDLSEISQQLYDLKLEKKSLIISLFETSNDINDIFKEITALKGEYEQKKINLEEEYEIFKKESFQIQPTARRSNKYYKKNKHNKEELFLHRNKIIGNKAELDQELRGKLDSLNENKSILDYKIGHLNDQLYETNEKIRKIKLKLNQRYKALINYYLDILSKGIDVRRNGLVWCVIRLISLKAFFTYENFPVFLTHEQIDYMIKIAYMQHEINELIGLFQILKKKQKELREDQILQQELLFKEKEEQMRKGKKQSISTIQNLIGKIERVAKKYEHVMNICLNEKKDDEHLSQICKNLHEKIISLHNEIELEEQSSENIELYFLPGSLAEFFNKNSKYRIYFDDILYLNKEISIKEKEISSLKDQQLKTYRKNYNNSNHSVQDELIFAALFGNGITV